MKPRMGRKLLWPERVEAKFARGTLARIADVLHDGEARLDFIREAINRELTRREKTGHKNSRRKRGRRL